MCLEKITDSEPKKKWIIGYKGVKRYLEDDDLQDICEIFRRGDVVIDTEGDRFKLKRRMTDMDRFEGAWNSEDIDVDCSDSFYNTELEEYISLMLPELAPLVTGIQNYPIEVGDTYEDKVDKDIGSDYVGHYRTGFHVCRTPEAARGYGSHVVKVRLSKITCIGTQSGDEVYVGRKIKVLELIE